MRSNENTKPQALRGIKNRSNEYNAMILQALNNKGNSRRTLATAKEWVRNVNKWLAAPTG
jgi:hypothetical protein